MTTVVFFGAVWIATVTSPGWDTVKATFFSVDDAQAAFPSIWHAFWRYNVLLFLIGEVLVLIVAMAVALIRQSKSPVLLPLRIVAIVYTDLFRGIPTILLVFMLAFGVPALDLQGLTNSLFVWGLVALVLSYGAYVAEVIRSGIESIHPSQVASADALGLSPLPGDALRRRPPGRAARHPPVAQRLRQPAEGHRTGGSRRRLRRDVRGP